MDRAAKPACNKVKVRALKRLEMRKLPGRPKSELPQGKPGRRSRYGAFDASFSPRWLARWAFYLGLIDIYRQSSLC